MGDHTHDCVIFDGKGRLFEWTDLTKWTLLKRSLLQQVEKEGVRDLELEKDLAHYYYFEDGGESHDKECRQPSKLKVTSGW
jgi:hypothetical protein